jgi:predicted permease
MGPPHVVRWLIQAASLLVRRTDRSEWTEEWLAELDALETARSGGAAAGDSLPHPIPFALGALPHALYLKSEEWTMDSLLHDLRYSLRLLTRARAFTLVAAATLALGIGANGAIFSLVNGLVLRAPAGIREPDRLVQIARSYESAPRWDVWSSPAFDLIRRESEALADATGFWGTAFVLGRGVDAEAIWGQVVTANFFDVLGVTPQLGRLFGASEDREPVEGRAVVISHALWKQRMGGDPAVVGREIWLGSQPFVVLGVAPAGFAGPQTLGRTPLLWVPALHHPEYAGAVREMEWGRSWINVVGRLEGGVSFEQAQASMDVVSTRLRRADPINEDVQVLLAEGIGLDPNDRTEARNVSLILMTIAGLVLLLTCTNVATLSLARASARRAEVGVRMTLGASRVRLGRQMLTEGVVLALLATGLAIPLVVLAKNALPLIVPYPLSVSLGADLRVLLFLAALGALAGLLFSAAPAWSSTRRGVSEGLREGAGTGPCSRTRLRDALVVVQLALSLGLVAGAGLLGRSVLNARLARPGFDPENVTVGYIDPQPTGRYDATNGRELYRGILARVAEVPGVVSATWSNQTPLVGPNRSRSTVRPWDQPESDGFEAEYNVVGPDYFETLGLELLSGRTLGGFDDEPEQVVVVNEALAGLFWPGQDPIGKELRFRGEEPWRVVGLVKDVQMRSLREAGRPGVYYPISHVYPPSGVLQVKSAGGSVPPEAIRSAVAAVDPELPVTGIQDLQSGMAASMGETRTIAYLIGGFALLALALASVGLYGLVTYSASQRVREMGLRIAMGAKPASLVRLVLARGLVISVVGSVFGLGLSLLLGRALRGLLFGVTATDGWALGGAALLLLVISGAAAWVPARRASRVDPAVSLRG